MYVVMYAKGAIIDNSICTIFNRLDQMLQSYQYMCTFQSILSINLVASYLHSFVVYAFMLYMHVC